MLHRAGVQWRGKTTRAGFTGQEMLDGVGLIHMNGRVYDPAVGRFLSVDPRVRDSAASQSWNGYGYVEARLLSATDPSGWVTCPQCVVPIEPIVPTVTVTAPRLYPLGTIADFMAMWGGVDSSLQPSRPANEDAEKEETQTQESIQQCTASWNFDFGQFADQIEENRFDLGATLGTLFATEAIGTMPKTPSELRGLGVPKSELNPVTSQLSRWSDRLDARWMRDLGRTTGGRLASGAATLGVVFEGFYDIGVIGKAALDATSRIGCGP